MNEENRISADNLMSAYPEVLRNDETMNAIGTAMAKAFMSVLADIGGIRIYTRIDELPVELLDILAVDFKVDWWDPNYTLEEKRKTLRDSWSVRRTLGTKAAVERAISAIYSDTYVSEWFQYGGAPYHFTLHIDSTFEDVDPIKHQRVLDRLEYYKNLRSTPYLVEYTAMPFGKCTAYATLGLTALSGEMTVGVTGAPGLEV